MNWYLTRITAGVLISFIILGGIYWGFSAMPWRENGVREEFNKHSKEIQLEGKKNEVV